MALPLSGSSISLNQVNVELGLNATAQISLQDAGLRILFGKPTADSQISFADGYGKASQFSFTISSDQVNANLRSLAIAAGWDQTSTVVATVAAGVYIYSISTNTPALTINGSWPGGVTLINNGYIMGMGGSGGGSAGNTVSVTTSWPAENGGPAISLGTNVTIENNSYIAGGGGGAGGVTVVTSMALSSAGGAGGAGGGSAAPNYFKGGTADTNSFAGGAGGLPGQAGANGTGLTSSYTFSQTQGFTSGGGGRILPGTGGAGNVSNVVAQGGGSGGGGGSIPLWVPATFNPSMPIVGGIARTGGGGGWGAAGGYAAIGSNAGTSGAGGSGDSSGVNATNQTLLPAASGGLGGAAVALNGYSVTWTVFGTRYGQIA